jgi:antitoxin (DNA-binding transcriptional repressor) of toxin-antitoxin stability system
MDPIRPIKASRAVSMRELSRSISSLVDEIEMNGSLFVLSRYGRMVAVLAPIPERAVLEFSGNDWPAADLEEAAGGVEIRGEWGELTPEQRTVLSHAAEDHPANLYVSALRIPASPLAVSISRPELAGLLERNISGWKATIQGLAAARWLDSEDAAHSS